MCPDPSLLSASSPPPRTKTIPRQKNTFAHVLLDADALRFLVVGDVLLDGGHDAGALDAVDVGSRDARVELGIFAKAFEGSAV